MDQTVTFTQEAKRTHISAPYDRGFITAIKRIGGRWDASRKTWHVANEDVARAREITMKYFGSDGTAETEADRVTVLVDASDFYGWDSIEIGGRKIAWRRHRDESVKFGDDVIVREGRFRSSGGSRANPCLGENDAILEVRGMLRAIAESEGLEIVDEAQSKRAALQARKAQLLAEIEKIDAQLAGL